jgi:hypothetical protein
MKHLRIAALACFVLVSRAEGQYGPAQDSTLRGLTRVHLAFVNRGAYTPAALAQATDFITLELRKSGLQIARTQAELDVTKDAVLNVSMLKIARALSTDLLLRIDVEQRATMVRTNQALPLVTWFYEDDKRAVTPDQTPQAMLKQGVDKFLNAWLAANGR